MVDQDELVEYLTARVPYWWRCPDCGGDWTSRTGGYMGCYHAWHVRARHHAWIMSKFVHDGVGL